MAASLSNYMYYIGGSIGTAMFASIVTYGSGSLGIPVEELSNEAFMSGFTLSMVCATIISVLAFVAAFVINEKKIQRS